MPQSRAISSQKPKCANLAHAGANAYETVGNRRVKTLLKTPKTLIKNSKHCYQPSKLFSKDYFHITWPKSCSGFRLAFLRLNGRLSTRIRVPQNNRCRWLRAKIFRGQIVVRGYTDLQQALGRICREKSRSESSFRYLRRFETKHGGRNFQNCKIPRSFGHRCRKGIRFIWVVWRKTKSRRLFLRRFCVKNNKGAHAWLIMTPTHFRGLNSRPIASWKA